MGIKRLFISFGSIPLLVDSTMLGESINDMNTIHAMAMILIIIGGILIGIGLENGLNNKN